MTGQKGGNTRSPSSWHDLAGYAVRERNQGQAESDEDLSNDDSVDVGRSGCNGGANEWQDNTADKQRLADLELVCDGRDERGYHGL